MRIYLAGPMRNIPLFNFPAFHAAADKLRARGHHVFNPAEADNNRHSKDISAGNHSGSVEQAEREHGFDLRTALHADLKFICLEAEAIAMLPGWEGSKGATAELAVAHALGLHVMYLEAEHGF